MAIACLPAPAAFASSGDTTAEESAVSTTEATRIITLGTVAGPIALVKRSGSANVLQVGSRIYLIDAGPGVSHQLAMAGVQPAQIDRIFLTHLHFDHVAGLAPLLGYAWIARTGKPIEIYGPPATSTFVSDAEKYLSIPEGIYTAQIPPSPTIADLVKPHDVDVTGPSVIYEDDKVRVTAVENTHYSAMPDGRRPLGAARSYSYRFDTPDRSVVFTGDTGPSDAVVELAKGADVLVSEVLDLEGVIALMKKTAFAGATDAELKPTIDHQREEHLTPTEVGRLAARAGVKMVVLTHVGPGSDNETDMRQYTQGVRDVFDGVVVIARDGSEF
ncbi:MBL fold metallo-hydrolase [Altererythrobacter sp. FM1]|uniref:MBL fold metallo-hydrolase n=1 Tax=Tsuneonella flava TaxID=2055955 RepID=UPI000C804C53|nr:MBL fold metallo-hydrolase [Tsuneonella flava]ROT97584.1 MBL fold metallo-hydrolase [Altererythrobacter sp. FM1]